MTTFDSIRTNTTSTIAAFIGCGLGVEHVDIRFYRSGQCADLWLAQRIKDCLLTSDGLISIRPPFPDRDVYVIRIQGISIPIPLEKVSIRECGYRRISIHMYLSGAGFNLEGDAEFKPEEWEEIQHNLERIRKEVDNRGKRTPSER